MLGPVEPPFPSLTFKQNFTHSTLREVFNHPGDPFHLFPFTPFEKILPSDSKFRGNILKIKIVGAVKSRCVVKNIYILKVIMSSKAYCFCLCRHSVCLSICIKFLRISQVKLLAAYRPNFTISVISTNLICEYHQHFPFCCTKRPSENLVRL